MATDARTDAIRALIAAWRGHADLLNGNAKNTVVESLIAQRVNTFRECADALDVLLTAQPATVTVSGVTGPDADSINGTHAIAQPAEGSECVWATAGDSDVWETSCKREFQLNDGTPNENGMRFCFHCGKPLVELLPDPPKELEP